MDLVGARFDPSIVLSLSYQSESLPPGVSETDLYIAYYDGASWINLKSTLDTITKTVKADILGFGSYALLGKMPQPVLPTSTAINSIDADSYSHHSYFNPYKYFTRFDRYT